MNKNTDPDATSDAFLSRWAKRKAEARKPHQADDELPASAEEQAEAQTTTLPETEEDEALSDEALCEKYELPHPEQCEQPEQLDEYFKKPLPDRLKQLAMRRMWRINPLFRFADEMVEYGENYTDAATVIPDMQTAYQVGKGYLEKLLKEQEKKEAAEAAQALELAETEKISANKPVSDTVSERQENLNLDTKENPSQDADPAPANDIAGESRPESQAEDWAEPAHILSANTDKTIHNMEKSEQDHLDENVGATSIPPRPRQMVFVKKSNNTDK